MRRALLLIGLFALPAAALAANTTFVGQIVPQCPDTICRACDLVSLADNILRFMVELAVFVAALMFAYAGFLYVTAAASKSNLETAKKIFWNVFLGLIFILTAWLIIDLSLRVLTTKDLNVMTQIQCVDFVGASDANPTGFQQSPGVTPNVGNPIGSAPLAGRLTDAEARSRLTTAGIGIDSSGNCSVQSVSVCTSLDGIPESTVTNLINMKQQCEQSTGSACDITVTGGTEVGHKSHGSGRPIVDIRYSQKTADFITANRASLGITSICTTDALAQYRYNCSFVETEPHLHLQFGL